MIVHTAYSLGFERLLVINQDGVLPEGMLRYIGINTETFTEFADCCSVVERALDRSGWTSDYSRRLRAERLRFADDPIRYSSLTGHFLYLDLRNDRPDIAALGATARLSEFSPIGHPLRPSPIRSPLKATGFPGFSHTIFPKSYEAFDLLCVGAYSPPAALGFLTPPGSGALVGTSMVHEEPGVYLNTALDVVGAPHLPIASGVWMLRYEFFAIDFPVLSVLIELTLRDGAKPTARILTQDVI